MKCALNGQMGCGHLGKGLKEDTTGMWLFLEWLRK